jgi:long-subunit acyl-CoA synthetase (AMP-forming)
VTSNTKISSPPAIRTFDWQMPRRRMGRDLLNYTSGTTGNPKGVVYHHRGAAEWVGNVI